MILLILGISANCQAKELLLVLLIKVKVAGLREPEFIGGEVDLRINIYRGQISGKNFLQHGISDSMNAVKPPENCRKTADKMPISEQEKLIFHYAFENGGITTAQVTELLDIKQCRAREILVKMVEKRWLNKEGASRSTVYVINAEGK